MRHSHRPLLSGKGKVAVDKVASLVERYPKVDGKERAALIEFAKTAPFEYGSWRPFKQLYKKCEEAPESRLLAALIGRIDRADFESRPPPKDSAKSVASGATLAYLKRRARRFLRRLGKKSPDIYGKTVERLLLNNYAGMAGLDLGVNWVAVDLLFGGGKRLYQNDNGRGAYTASEVRRQSDVREERFPDLLDARRRLWSRILRSSELPWEFYESAVCAMRTLGEPLPHINDKKISGFIKSPSPVLQEVALTNLLAKLKHGQLLDPVDCARAVLLGNDKQNEKFASHVKARIANKRFARPFANELFRVLVHWLDVFGRPERFNDAWRLLAHEFSHCVSPELVFENASQLLYMNLKSSAVLKSFADVIAGTMKRATPALRRSWLETAVKHWAGRIIPWGPMSPPLRVVIETLIELMDATLASVTIQHAPTILGSYHPTLQRLALAAFRSGDDANVLTWANLFLWQRPRGSPDRGSPDTDILRCVQHRAFPLFVLKDLLVQLVPEMRALGWRLVTASRTRTAVLEEFWAGLVTRELHSWIVKVQETSAVREPNSTIPEHANAILQEALRQHAIIARIRKIHFAPDDVDEQWWVRMCYHGDQDVQAGAWKIIVKMGAPTGLVTALVGAIDDLKNDAATIQRVLSNSDALEIFVSDSDLDEHIRNYLAQNPAIVDGLTKRSCATILRAADDEIALLLVDTATEDNWRRLRSVFRRILGSEHRRSTFANAFLAHIKNKPNAPSAARLGSRWLRRILIDSADDHILEVRGNELARVVVAWCRRRQELFSRGSDLLYRAVTHRLETVRSWARGRLQEAGLDAHFALRLLESDVPDAAVIAKRFLDTTPRGGAQELDVALMLCDSPNKGSRSYGREFIDARTATLPMDDVICRLTEHADLEMQAFVAKFVVMYDKSIPGFTAFTRHVMRRRDHGRDTKEVVKSSLADNVSPDLDLLMELARSNTPRDSEWALSQLARRAIEGETATGLEIRGVAGG